MFAKQRYQDIFDTLENNGVEVESEIRNRVKNRLDEILSYKPRVGLFGKTGVGKSSLCNALFGEDVAKISDVYACSRHPEEFILKINDKEIALVDVPGVGENSERDKEYAELYQKLLPELDVVLWLLKADDRAFTSDEIFYKNVVKPHIDLGKPFFFVVNQVDKIEPHREWNEELREPGLNQLRNIATKKTVVSETFSISESQVIMISANEKYNLQMLVDEVIARLPKEKKVTLAQQITSENISDLTRNKVENSWLEIIDEVCETFIPLYRELKKNGKIIIYACKEIIKAGKEFFDGILSIFNR